MKILMVAPGRLPVPAVRGGAVENLIELLLNYNEKYRMADITVISSYDSEAVEKSREYRKTEFFFFRRNDFSEWMMKKHILPYRFFDYCYSRKAGSFLQKKDLHFDVAVIQNELVNGWVMKRYLKIPFIYHAHNDTLSGKRDIRFLKACDHVITISGYLAECFRKKAGISQVSTVYNGIDTGLFDPCIQQKRRNILRKQYGISPDDTVVVFAGRLAPEKGIGVLLEAVKKLSEKKRIILLVIGASFFQKSGDNVFVKQLKNMSSPVRDQIIFSGYVDYQKMPDYYSMADIGCIPSLWEEPFGLSVVEQMAMELPVIATDAGAISEIVDESCGYLLTRDSRLSDKIAEAILELSRDPEKRRMMGQAGRKKVMKYFNRTVFCENWFRVVMERSSDEPVL